MLFWYFRTAISMEEGKLHRQHRFDLRPLASNKRQQIVSSGGKTKMAKQFAHVPTKQLLLAG
jgi:hypothetical protein